MSAYEVRPKIVEGRKTVLEVVGPGGWVVTEYDTAKRKDAATLAEVLNHADQIARDSSGPSATVREFVSLYRWHVRDMGHSLSAGTPAGDLMLQKADAAHADMGGL